MPVNHIYSLLQTERAQNGNASLWRNIPVDNSQYEPLMKVKVISSCLIGNSSSDGLIILKCHNRAVNHTSSDNINRIVCGFLYITSTDAVTSTDDFMFKNAGLEFLMRTNPDHWEFSLWNASNVQLAYADVTAINIVISVEYVEKESVRQNVDALLL